MIQPVTADRVPACLFQPMKHMLLRHSRKEGHIDLPQALVDFEFDVELTGFSLAEVDLEEAGEADPESRDAVDDAVAIATGPAVPADVTCGSWGGIACFAEMPRARMTSRP